MTNMTWPVYLLLAATLLLGIVDTGYVYSVAHESSSVPSARDIASKVVVPSVDLTNVTSDLAALKQTVNKDDSWKTSAENLALTEAEKNGNRDIFNFLSAHNVTVVEKQDITQVAVKDQKVTSFDADRHDATVVQELRVRYDSNSGSDRVYLDVITVVKDGEVDTQDFAFH